MVTELSATPMSRALKALDFSSVIAFFLLVD